MVDTVIKLRSLGHRVVLVTSGTIGAVAAFGQGRLMRMYDGLFSQLNQQILLPIDHIAWEFIGSQHSSTPGSDSTSSITQQQGGLSGTDLKAAILQKGAAVKSTWFLTPDNNQSQKEVLYTHLTWGEFTSLFCSDFQDEEEYDNKILITCKIRAANLICQWAFLFLAILWARFLHLGYIDESLDIGSKLVFNDSNYNNFDSDDLNPDREHGNTNSGGKGE
ncbi:7154_t:CDS:2 [Diversispora eburnea]|uniref:7154_t:CDS:1 n=1 Tax=Diversispora eburnea TaxID=1213867 RepID=A0A9N9FXD6_9GLOM|nr:7154_t:CDS:2 [Diversispora eburnea]